MPDKFLFNNAGQITEKAAIDISTGVSSSGKVISADSTGRLDPSFMPLGFGSEVLTVMASEALAAGDFVNIWDNGGTPNARKADASAGNAKKADGFVLASFTNGAIATVYYGNLNNQKTALTVGAIYYLSAAAPGGIVTAPPTTPNHIVQRLGKAVSPTTILVEIQDTITLA
jgi:hypothetical protein